MYYPSLVRFFETNPSQRRTFFRAYTFEIFATGIDYWYIGKNRNTCLLDPHLRILEMERDGMLALAPLNGVQRGVDVANAVYEYMDANFIKSAINGLASNFDTGAVWYVDPMDRYATAKNARKHPAFQPWALHFAALRGESEISIET